MVNLLELVPPKVKLVGFHVGFRCGFDDRTQGTQRVGGEPDQGEHTRRQNVATSPDSAQKRPNGTFSPLPSVKPGFFLLAVFSAVHFLQRNAHSGSKLVFGFLESGMPSPDSTQACWGKHSPNATRPKKN